SEVPAIGVLTIVGLVALGRPGTRLRVVSLPRLTTPTSPALFIVAAGAIGVVAAAAWRAGLMARWTSPLRGRGTPLFRGVRIAPSALVVSAVLSAVLWGLDVIRLRTAAAAIRAPIGLPQAAALSAITIAAGWVPTIGGLGIIEGGLIGGLIAFGVAPADAAAVTAIE